MVTIEGLAYIYKCYEDTGDIYYLFLANQNMVEMINRNKRVIDANDSIPKAERSKVYKMRNAEFKKIKPWKIEKKWLTPFFSMLKSLKLKEDHR